MLLTELKSPQAVVELEKQLDKLFMPLGLDVEFSRHFIQRILGREKLVTADDIIHAFAGMKKKFKQKLISAKRKNNYEAVLKDFSTELNIVFGVNGGQLDAITIMHKNPNNFHPNKKGGEELKVN